MEDTLKVQIDSTFGRFEFSNGENWNLKDKGDYFIERTIQTLLSNSQYYRYVDSEEGWFYVSKKRFELAKKIQ